MLSALQLGLRGCIGAPVVWVIGERAGGWVPAASRGARGVGRAGMCRCPQVCGADPIPRGRALLPPCGLCKEPLPEGALGAGQSPCADNDELSDFQQRLQSVFSFPPPASQPHTIAAQPAPASGACQISRPRSFCFS